MHMCILGVFMVFVAICGVKPAHAVGTASITGIQAPVGMVYDAEGALFVAEWGADRVSKFDMRGRRSLVTDGVRNPAGLAFDEQGTLFIASYATGEIFALDKAGQLRSIAGGFSSPTGMLWKDGVLLVAKDRKSVV